MFEDNCYEPIAEIYLSLIGQPSVDNIYCLCSRVFVEGSNEKEENAQEEGEAIKDIKKTDHSGEAIVRFCSSFAESQLAHSPKKIHEEAVSCYCSASHYSTDEHDSLRDSGLHHSDSGADLSESSRDVDWERYWTLHGERLIWESWISKYGSYIDPSYFPVGTNLNGNNVLLVDNSTQQPSDGDETSFCIQSDKVSDPNRRTSFTGLLESVKTEDKSDDVPAPKILVESVKNDVDELLNRRLSDISETAKSALSEECSNFDDNDKLRLSIFSRCSGSSAPLSATTDSMTNVTRITLSSSDSSYGVDDSSAKSSSILTSSDSASSLDQQWQQLWAEHFNEQYSYHYNKFTETHNIKKKCSDELKSDSGLLVEDRKLPHIRPSDPQHQESIDDVVSIETQDSVFDSDNSKPSSLAESTKSSSKSEQSKKLSQKRLLSVGHLLQQLNAMSVETSGTIQEEEKHTTSLLQPLTMESVKNATETVKPGDSVKEENKECVSDQVIDHAAHTNDTHTRHVFKDFSDRIGYQNASKDVDIKNSEDELKVNEHAVMEADSDEELTNARHGIKRSHESENDESIEKVKSAYQLMGFMFNLENTKKIRKASVWYKKRFSQIRFQNRILRLQKLPKHIYFDEDEVGNDTSQLNCTTFNESQAVNGSGELFQDAEKAAQQLENEVLDPNSIDIEEFSEKDDSTDDDKDIFFSAEEDILIDGSKERRENKCKNIPKRKKKRQLKKKSTINYPEEMIDNPKIKKFWRRRYSLFSKFDEGIKMDAESWYSVTPEKIAVNIAERCQCDLVVDAFCGAGGNAIQLAFTCEQVIAVDIDPHKIELARNNARVYGVEDRIEFIVGDYLQLAHSLVADVVFLSPPWGGLSYNKQAVFPLSSLQPVKGQELFEITTAITENIAFYLPKTVNTQELVECAGPGGCVEIVQNFLDRELVAVTAYFGELVNEIE